jgi:hypothetical protein
MHLEPTRSGILFQTAPGSEIYWNGALLHYDQAALYEAGGSNIFRSTGPSQYAVLSLDAADLRAMLGLAATREHAPEYGRAITASGSTP